MLDPEARKILVRPFAPEECSKRRGPGGRDLTYVDQHAVICRINEAFGVGGWSWKLHHCVIQDGLVMVAGSLSANGSSHDGCSVEPLDGKRDPEMAMKIADTDALKRAARLFGVGLHLYDKSDPVHGQVKSRGPHTPYAERNRGGPPPASRKQKDLIMKLCIERGMAPLEIDERLHKRFGKKLAEIDVKQAGEVIDLMINGGGDE